MMKDFFSAAVFSPPDDISPSAEPIATTQNVGGSVEGGSSTSQAAEAPSHSAETISEHEAPRVETITDSIRRAFSEAKEKIDGNENDRKAENTRQNAGRREGRAKGEARGTAQGADGPPASWNAQEKQDWAQLTDRVKAAITRREADTVRGVNELRSRYQDIDTAVAPYQSVMRANNVTPAQAISQLFKWHMELAGPNKVAAYLQLGKNFGIDLGTLANSQSQSGAQQQDATNFYDYTPAITNLDSRIRTFEERESAALQNAAQQTWINWSKDKPHVETVRTLMADLINSDLNRIQAGQPQVSNTIVNGSIDMDAAYQAAIYAHPQVRQTILQEQQASRDKAARNAAEKAKKAGMGMRSGSPAGAMAPAGATPRNESVRDSITRALAEVRGGQQH